MSASHRRRAGRLPLSSALLAMLLTATLPLHQDDQERGGREVRARMQVPPVVNQLNGCRIVISPKPQASAFLSGTVPDEQEIDVHFFLDDMTSVNVLPVDSAERGWDLETEEDEIARASFRVFEQDEVWRMKKSDDATLLEVEVRGDPTTWKPEEPVVLTASEPRDVGDEKKQLTLKVSCAGGWFEVLLTDL